MQDGVALTDEATRVVAISDDDEDSNVDETSEDDEDAAVVEDMATDDDDDRQKALKTLNLHTPWKDVKEITSHVPEVCTAVRSHTDWHTVSVDVRNRVNSVEMQVGVAMADEETEVVERTSDDEEDATVDVASDDDEDAAAAVDESDTDADTDVVEETSDDVEDISAEEDDRQEGSRNSYKQAEADGVNAIDVHRLGFPPTDAQMLAHSAGDSIFMALTRLTVQVDEEVAEAEAEVVEGISVDDDVDVGAVEDVSADEDDTQLPVDCLIMQISPSKDTKTHELVAEVNDVQADAHAAALGAPTTWISEVLQVDEGVADGDAEVIETALGNVDDSRPTVEEALPEATEEEADSCAVLLARADDELELCTDEDAIAEENDEAGICEEDEVFEEASEEDTALQSPKPGWPGGKVSGHLTRISSTDYTYNQYHSNL
ncbi:hypothetical protein ACN47E_000478 [Coniothyrium glycines]